MHDEQRSVPRSFNKTALTAAGGTPPSGPRIALGVSRDLKFQSSDGGSRKQPFVPADAAGKSPAPRAYSGKHEGRTSFENGALQMAGSSMSYGSAKSIVAGQAPGPSDSIHPSVSPDIRELAAFVFVGAFCIWVAVTMVNLTHIPFFEVFDLG